MFIVISKTFNNQSPNYIYLNSICELKFLNGQYDLLLYDVQLNNDGIIEEFGLSLDEVLITIKINHIYANFINDKLIEIGNYYHIPVLHNT